MDYIFDVSKTLIIVSIACALLTMLFYKTNLYQSVRFICSVVILAYMVQAFLPFYSAIGDLIVIDEHEESEASDGAEKNENHYVNYVTVGICQKIKSIICNRYNVNDEDVKVSLTINNDDPENIIIKNVTVTLTDDSAEVSADISRYIGDMLGCGCTVLIK